MLSKRPKKFTKRFFVEIRPPENQRLPNCSETTQIGWNNFSGSFLDTYFSIHLPSRSQKRFSVFWRSLIAARENFQEKNMLAKFWHFLTFNFLHFQNRNRDLQLRVVGGTYKSYQTIRMMGASNPENGSFVRQLLAECQLSQKCP